MLNFKERHIISLLLLLTALAVGLIFLIPAKPPSQQQTRLPWEIHIDSQNTLRVFDISLEKTTLLSTRAIFQKEEELTLFKNGDSYSLEAYFGSVNLDGLKANIILTLAASDQQLTALYENGSRMSKMGSGEYKITLSATDFPLVNQLAVQYITYIPAKDLTPQMIAGRFGSPSEKIIETNKKITHWLYPKKGLDIAVASEGKEVLQYFPPAKFHKINQTLLNQN